MPKVRYEVLTEVNMSLLFLMGVTPRALVRTGVTTLKLETACSSVTLVCTCKSIRRYSPADQQRCMLIV
jgi:hypothetical protein